MHKVLIVDDEPKARQNIINSLKVHEDFIIVAEADNCDDAFKKILTEKPDIVFLDINMPQEDGFDLLDLLSKLGIENLSIIFLTAYNEYAIKAIKQGVFDYLLKPVDPEELKKTLDRYRLKKTNSFGEGAQRLKEYFRQGNKIKFNTNKGYIYFLPCDII
ncbi:MAG TPA: response regulator, partial [Bacteroidales bacterium]|nr:response regulator [Bacteroidales bacterium]